jgi:hypothetical protein
MTISFKNDSDNLVYALEMIIAFAKGNQYIFLAQSVWWISSVIGLQAELIIHIDNLRTWSEFVSESSVDSARARELQKKDDPGRQDRILKECEEYLRDSRRLRQLVALKATGKTKTGRINSLPSLKQALKVAKKDKNRDLTKGIQEGEIDRRKVEGECLRCAWPSDRKGSHRVKDCI